MDYMGGRYFFNKPEKVGLVSTETFGVPASSIRHIYVKGKDIACATAVVNGIYQDSLRIFSGKMPMAFDKFNPLHAEIMKPIMRNDKRMADVFRILEMDYSNVQKLYLPWWNMEGGMEISCRKDGGGVLVELGSRHSYQTQLMRQGVDIQGMNSVSVAGIVHTSDNKLVVGLRGGFNFPNTYYFNAGALNMTEQLKGGTATIYGTYLRTELRDEYGLSSEASRATLLSRVECHGKDRDISYVFAIRTPATFDEIRKIHGTNPHPDKHEHRFLEALDATQDAVMDFVRLFYKGAAANDSARRFEERVLLPQGAAPLIDYVSGDVAALEKFV